MRTVINQNCKCPNIKCPRHGNCRECYEFHKKKGQPTHCGKSGEASMYFRYLGAFQKYAGV